MIANHQEFLVSLEQLQELELALDSVKRDASSPESFHIQAEVDTHGLTPVALGD